MRELRGPYIVYHLYADESPSGVRGEANEEREDKPNPDKENEDEWYVERRLPTLIAHKTCRCSPLTKTYGSCTL